MSEFITIQVGQCGNQVGSEFWPEILKEYGLIESSKSRWNGSFNSFLYPTSGATPDPLDLRNGNIKARAVLIDMEESVVSRFEKGPLRNLFEKDCILTNSGGSGNNWGVGFYSHGNELLDILDEMIRISAEKCDCLHGFLSMYSLSGGTGSGLGTRLLTFLSDFYSKTERFAVCVHPGTQYDVINAPYNIGFTLSSLTEYASCVFPVDNEALTNIIQTHKVPLLDRQMTGVMKLDTYNSMNKIICKMLLELTSGARFPGSLNLDMNDLTTNLVPFPMLNFISSSLSPIVTGKFRRAPHIPKITDAVNEILSRHNELLRINALKGTILSGCLHGRGNISITNMKHFCQRVKKQCRRAVWLQNIRYGLCSVPPVDSSYSFMCLANSTSMSNLFLETFQNFERLYRKRAFVHHYTQVPDFDQDEFNLTLESIMNVVQKYNLKDIPLEVDYLK